jgi:hypothetical protein
MIRSQLETERNAVVAKLVAVQDQLYQAGRDGASQPEIERLRGQVFAALGRRDKSDRLIRAMYDDEQTLEAGS